MHIKKPIILGGYFMPYEDTKYLGFAPSSLIVGFDKDNSGAFKVNFGNREVSSYLKIKLIQQQF